MLNGLHIALDVLAIAVTLAAAGGDSTLPASLAPMKLHPRLPPIHNKARPVAMGDDSAAGRCNISRIAYVHVPKSGGVSLFLSLDAAEVATCNHGTGLSGFAFRHARPCECTKAACMRSSRVAVMEQTHGWMRRRLFPTEGGGWGRCAVWMATVREPSEWFYSAVGQWCAGPWGRNQPPCQPRANVSTLLAFGFFGQGNQLQQGQEAEKGVPEVGVPERDVLGQPKYYFRGPDLQSQMVSGVMHEADHLVCALPDRDRILDAMGKLLPRSPTLSAATANEAHWPGLDDFRRRVPWSSVRDRYAADERLYERLRASGCVSRGTNTRLNMSR